VIKGGNMKNYMNWKKRSNNSKGKIIIGAVAGMAVGLTAGMLTAPRSGREIRGLLSSRTSETIQKVGKTIEETTHRK
jgi:gas vesicle protein